MGIEAERRAIERQCAELRIINSWIISCLRLGLVTPATEDVIWLESERIIKEASQLETRLKEVLEKRDGS